MLKSDLFAQLAGEIWIQSLTLMRMTMWVIRWHKEEEGIQCLRNMVMPEWILSVIPSLSLNYVS